MEGLTGAGSSKSKIESGKWLRWVLGVAILVSIGYGAYHYLTKTTNLFSTNTTSTTNSTTNSTTSPAVTEKAGDSITNIIANQISLQNALDEKQSLASNLTSLGGLAYTSGAFVKMTGANTFTLDTNTYLTTGLASSTYVPYSGVTGDVGLGTHSLATTGLGSFGAGKINTTAGNGGQSQSDSIFTINGGLQLDAVNSGPNSSVVGVYPAGTPGTAGNLANGTYYYVITTTDAVGTESVKGTQSTGQVVTGPNGSVALSWSAIGGVNYYRIYRTTTSGTYATPSFIAQVKGGTLTYTDTALNPAAGAPPATTAGLAGLTYRVTGEAAGDPALVFRANAYFFESSDPIWLMVLTPTGVNVGHGAVSTWKPVSPFSVSGGTTIGSTYADRYVAPTDGLIVQGQVGIGITAPSANTKLHVGGGGQVQGNFYEVARISDPQETKGVVIGYDNSAVMGVIASDQGTSGLAFWIHNGSAYLEAMRISKDGNVGIGTTAPWQKLSLAGVSKLSFGNVSYPFDIYQGSASTAYFDLGYDDQPAKIFFRMRTGGTPVNVLTLTGAGFVGIGQTAPTSPLQVVGLPQYANNAAAVAGGLTAGAFYRTGGDPDLVSVVH